VYFSWLTGTEPDFTERTPEELSIGLLSTSMLTNMAAGGGPVSRCDARPTAHSAYCA
jgi:hypothetical protein